MEQKISEKIDNQNNVSSNNSMEDKKNNQLTKNDRSKKIPDKFSSILNESKITSAKTESSLVFENSIYSKILTKFESKIKLEFVKPLRIKILVAPENIMEIAKFLNHEIGFDHAESVTGTDYPKDEQIEVIYHLGSYTQEDLAPFIFSLTTRTDRDNAHLPSLITVYGSAEYHEREIYEMLGVYFDGHPRNERFLLPEDWADMPPLRKEFRIKGR